MSIIKNGGLDQYGAGHFEQQQFGTAGVEGVKCASYILLRYGIRPYRRRNSLGHRRPIFMSEDRFKNATLAAERSS